MWGCLVKKHGFVTRNFIEFCSFWDLLYSMQNKKQMKGQHKTRWCEDIEATQVWDNSLMFRWVLNRGFITHVTRDIVVDKNRPWNSASVHKIWEYKLPDRVMKVGTVNRFNMRRWIKMSWSGCRGLGNFSCRDEFLSWCSICFIANSWDTKNRSERRRIIMLRCVRVSGARGVMIGSWGIGG